MKLCNAEGSGMNLANNRPMYTWKCHRKTRGIVLCPALSARKESLPQVKDRMVSPVESPVASSRPAVHEQVRHRGARAAMVCTCPGSPKFITFHANLTYCHGPWGYPAAQDRGLALRISSQVASGQFYAERNTIIPRLTWATPWEAKPGAPGPASSWAYSSRHAEPRVSGCACR